jgi:hypothetical protein
VRTVPRPRILLVSLLAAVALVTGVLVTTGLLGSGERALDRCTRLAREGDRIQTRGWSWRPLGIRCAIIHPNGATTIAVTDPW